MRFAPQADKCVGKNRVKKKRRRAVRTHDQPPIPRFSRRCRRPPRLGTHRGFFPLLRVGGLRAAEVCRRPSEYLPADSRTPACVEGRSASFPHLLPAEERPSSLFELESWCLSSVIWNPSISFLQLPHFPAGGFEYTGNFLHYFVYFCVRKSLVIRLKNYSECKRGFSVFSKSIKQFRTSNHIVF